MDFTVQNFWGRKNNVYYCIFALIVLFVLGFNLFYGLNKIPLSNWDEARHGANAYEMLKNKNPIVNTYDYQNDYYNLKPPLSFWGIMLGYKIFGYNPLGLRFFSALAAMLTVLLTALFVKYRHGKKASLITALVLATTNPFILVHCARTGDADSIFMLFFTTAILSMILSPRNIKWLYLAGLSFGFAFLAKSWHSLPIVAIIGLYLIISGELFKLKAKQWVIFLISSFLPIFIWGLLRYSQDGGRFLNGMIELDLLKRTGSPLEGHLGGPLYYLKELFKFCGVWIVLLLSFVGYLGFNRRKIDKQGKDYYLAITLWILIPFILFTIARTKLPWYIYPIYPAIAIYIGAFFQRLFHGERQNLILRYIMVFVLAIGLLYYESIIIQRVTDFRPDKVQLALEEMKTVKKYHGADIFTLCGVNSKAQQWEQSQFLAAELYGDFRPKDGGINGFLANQEEHALMVVPNNSETEGLFVKNRLKVVIKTDAIYVVEKDDKR